MTDLFDHEPPRAATPSPAGRRSKASGLAAMRVGRSEILIVIAAIVLVAWGAWVTKTLIAGPPKQEFVQLQLQGIIGEYLQAQARSGSDEAKAAQETAVFMRTLDQTVAGLSAGGKVVLVHEAVIGGDIPDITDAVRRQVYGQVARPEMMPADGVQGEMEAYLSTEGVPDVAAR
ncbi:TrbI F-type domain-containing protein [Croceicoccus hydrothermalis]|uniref:TrbI F-type domain-containing protein n=1 Tax=Croceicoccus hydrothermalis TaxID=2867964 RepID=UPI001EFB9AD1|nr:TrbI F-type domain-containing protein [Croceicoccus hydrothermalis]